MGCIFSGRGTLEVEIEERAMNLTLGRVSTAVYGLCFVIVAGMAVAGKVGSVDLTSTVGWVLVGWLAGYKAILVMLVGGTIRWFFTDVLRQPLKQARY